MYKWKKQPFVNANGDTLHVHYDYLHKTPFDTLVYKGIEDTRLFGIKNKARLETNFDAD